MTPEQCRMARAALKWSGADLAEASGVGSATVARFELAQPVQQDKLQVMRAALEAAGVHFIDTGKFAGAVQLRLKNG